MYCIYMWVSPPPKIKNKQVGLILIPDADCTFSKYMPSTLVWVTINCLSLSRTLVDTHTDKKKQKTHYSSTISFCCLPSSLLVFLLLPNPEWKGLGGSQMVDVWMPINWCLSLFPPCPFNSPLETLFACIMAPAFPFFPTLVSDLPQEGAELKEREVPGMGSQRRVVYSRREKRKRK